MEEVVDEAKKISSKKNAKFSFSWYIFLVVIQSMICLCNSKILFQRRYYKFITVNNLKEIIREAKEAENPSLVKKKKTEQQENQQELEQDSEEQEPDKRATKVTSPASVQKPKGLDHSLLKLMSPEQEEELANWVREITGKGEIVTTEMFVEKARAVSGKNR